jgi:hypothetical protein
MNSEVVGRFLQVQFDLAGSVWDPNPTGRMDNPRKKSSNGPHREMFAMAVSLRLDCGSRIASSMDVGDSWIFKIDGQRAD